MRAGLVLLDVDGSRARVCRPLELSEVERMAARP
jgi:hypothetical protein